MNVFQMVAGQPPPCVPGIPPTLAMLLRSCLRSFVNSATDSAACFGVEPMNQASEEPWLIPRVPVLPITPPRRNQTLASAVPWPPRLLSKDSAQSTSAAAAVLITCFATRWFGTVLPFCVSAATTFGVWYRPSSARVANVDACSTGVSGFWPSAMVTDPPVSFFDGIAPPSLVPKFGCRPFTGPVRSLQSAQIFAWLPESLPGTEHGSTNAFWPTPNALAMLITFWTPSRCARSSNDGSEEMAAATLTASGLPEFSLGSSNVK